MVLDLIVTNTNDGFTAEIPSINGCETWDAKLDDVIEKSISLLQFYLSLNEKDKIIIDKARVEDNVTIYKVVFNKV